MVVTPSVTDSAFGGNGGKGRGDGRIVDEDDDALSRLGEEIGEASAAKREGFDMVLETERLVLAEDRSEGPCCVAHGLVMPDRS